MGFFKSILSDAVGSSIADALTGDAAKKLGGKLMGRAAEAAVGAAVESTTRAAVTSLTTKKALSQAAPPPVPAAHAAMSVMVAVNGQSYGPYERATLLEMISNGSLTQETYVFIQGMDGWKAASEVPQVAELFALKSPAPAVPPVPWQGAPQAPSAPAPAAQPTASDNSLSPRLNSLINAAVADGEISDLERQVLIRNAQQEGVSMDEFVMVLEARLFEQQQVLRSQQQEAANKQKAAEAAAVTAAAAVRAATGPARPSRPEVRKCPACGEIINDVLATKCKQCGYEFDHPAEKSSESSWERLGARIAAERAKSGNVFKEMFSSTGPKLASIVSSFPVPSGKQDMFDFFTSCAPLAKPSGIFSQKDTIDKALEKAYYAKAQQVLIKARIVMKDDRDLLEQMETIAKRYKIKA